MGLVRPAEVQGSRGALRGMIHEPARAATGTAIILHGSFSSEKVGPSRLYVQLARIFSDAGYIVGRFDCYGVGESDGDFEDVTLSSELDDCRAIVAHVAGDDEDLCLLSHSGSAQLAIRLANERSARTSLVFLAPTIGPTVRYDRLFTAEQQDVLARGGTVTRKCVPISSAFMKALQEESSFELARSLRLRKPPVRAAVFYSSEDEYVTTEGAQRLGAALGAAPVSIPGADHNFLVQPARDVLLDEVRGLLGRWGGCGANMGTTSANSAIG